MRTPLDTGANVTLWLALVMASASLALEPAGSTLVATTPHFAFHSDFDTNLHDALLEAGRDRNFDRPGFFEAGDEATCFGELPGSMRTAWDLAVGFYAEEISPANWDDREQYWLRVDLAGVEKVERERDRTFVGIARSFMSAAAPAYEACRWEAQDEKNRSWIAERVTQLEVHEEAVARRLAELYENRLGGLPIRFDLVETVNWSGATTILLDPAGGHIQCSSEAYEGLAALEIVFHEASHTLMGRGAPIKNALAKAAEELEVPLPRDLWHGVLFYTTGDTVRRILAEAGQGSYTPLLFAQNIFGRFHEPMKGAWTAYLDGERTLEEAAMDLVRAVAEEEGDRP